MVWRSEKISRSKNCGNRVIKVSTWRSDASVEENRVSQERMQKVLMQPLISCGKRERKKALHLKVMLWLSAVVM